ncbi:MAG TPA: amidase family protein, partial [Pseudomonadales bacterium]|nr:amidase family protein [Pseudomonadales bacterium]
YAVDTREFLRAVKAPSVKGWRIVWTPDLGGLVVVDREVREVFEAAVGVFRGAGARMEAACPDMVEAPEIVRLTRGLLMVARHAEKLPRHRDVLQAGLVENTEQGLALTASDIARGELLRSALWNRVREFLAGCDLWITPTSATPPFPIEQPHAQAVDGQPVGRTLQRSYLTYAFSVLGLPAISIPAGFTGDGLPVGLQIVGKRGGEAAVLRAAAAFEAAQPWADRIPAVVPPRG